VAEALGHALDENAAGPLAPGSQLGLGRAEFRVVCAVVQSGGHALSGQTSYGELAFPWIYGQYEPESRITLQFLSPTTFRSNNLNHPTPLPGWTFGSLLEKWNAFAPVPLPTTVKEYAATHMALSKYELKTEKVPLKPGSMKFGAMGMATYTTPRPDEASLRALNLLAEFAFYAGVGAGTTMGFGQCRRLQAL